MPLRKYLGFAALVPFAMGLILHTGQNIISFRGLDDNEAVFVGLAFELFAFALVRASQSSTSRILFAWAFMVQAVLVLLWAIVLTVGSSLGDGASSGISTSDLLPWALSGLINASFAAYTLVSMIIASRKAKRDAFQRMGSPG
jgi:hypothetical protein